MPDQHTTSDLTVNDVLMGTEARKTLYGPDEDNGTIPRVRALAAELGSRVLTDLWQENLEFTNPEQVIRDRADLARSIAFWRGAPTLKAGA